ncbi:unnamed protein product [Ceutorhynchus assimilis]|uniref:BESS domain-containing protein n=1 Tax=Ceutorhynchus assimilis TaxID=467358 RepID=A0A9N9QN96_9CUCU|nr:unnamed protein product [Ceutorhynchus assimilis]
MSFKPKIDSQQLIEEVKKRPCLYDIKGVLHNQRSQGNHELKNAAWGEIGAALFQEKWKEFGLADKDAAVKDIQIKWKSLRDNYSRQLRILEQSKAGLIPAPTKKYIFHDMLSFLGPFIAKRDKTIASEDSNDSNSVISHEDSKANITIDPIEVSTTSQAQQVQYVSIQPKKFTMPTLTPIDLNSFGDEPPMKKVASCLQELVDFQKEDRSDDPLGNKRFLLSLLPFMKKLPDDVNLEVRLQLMSVLETYCNGKNLSS